MGKKELTGTKKNEGTIKKAYAFFITFNNPRVHGIAGITGRNGKYEQREDMPVSGREILQPSQ